MGESPLNKIEDQLHASMMSLQSRIADDWGKSIVEDIRRNKPYSWTQVGEEVLHVENYKGEEIKEIRFTYAPPEKEREPSNFSFSMFGGGKPDGLRKDNTTRRFETRNWSEKYKRYHMTAEKARAYVQENLDIDALAARLAPLVKFLEHDMPCTCGEYGMLSDREYLERAYEAFAIAKKIIS